MASSSLIHTIPTLLNTHYTIIINSCLKANYSLHHQHRHSRLLSTSNILPNSDQNSSSSHHAHTTRQTQDTIQETDHDINPSTDHKAREKLTHSRSLSTLANSVYLEPLKNQIGLIQKKLSQELGHLPTRLSQVTGYGDIDNLKRLVSEKEAALKASRAAAFEAKVNFNQAAQRRAESVKEVNDLLSRKASWSDQDLARFTMLVRTDHANEQAESEAKKVLEKSESQVDHQFTSMMQAILTRYHEEQIWSDKIRALSTTFSLSITVINVLVFLAAIVLVEPYKRSKVVSEVEERIIARDTKNSDILDRALNVVVDRLSSTEKGLSELILALKSPANDSNLMDQHEPKFQDEVSKVEAIIHEEELELENHQKKDEDIVDGVEELLLELEDHPPQVEQPSSSHNDKFLGLTNIYPSIWDRPSEQDLLKAIGLGAVVGIILMTSFQFFSR